VNLAERQIEVYTLPSGPAERPVYAQRHDFAEDAAVPVALNGVEIGQLPVRELLP
jgi:hypothetical protein